VIVIVPELEFDDAESGEAVATTVGTSSALAGSADPGEETMAKNGTIATTGPNYENLSTGFSAPSV
jgi:hypothetical protein